MMTKAFIVIGCCNNFGFGFKEEEEEEDWQQTFRNLFQINPKFIL